MNQVPPLIDTATLSSHLSDPQLRILDCRFDLGRPDWGRERYAAGHIPSALYADLNRDLSGPVGPGTGRHPLPTAAEFARTLGRWGLSSASEVVCYDQGNGAFASRLWWMLRAVGHASVRVLDGGYAAWLAAALPEQTAAPTAVPHDVTPREFAGVVSTSEVIAGLHAGSIRLIDARGADRFAGQNETIDPVAGHVPGAWNHPFAGNLGDDGRFRDGAALRAAWQPLIAGHERADLVMMCGSGVTACHNLLALSMAGVNGAKLYAGSFSEWISDPARPVATGAATQ
jgi:thiosulfate/3-mercaptopyruvate sulfurtransferase